MGGKEKVTERSDCDSRNGNRGTLGAKSNETTEDGVHGVHREIERPNPFGWAVEADSVPQRVARERYRTKMGKIERCFCVGGDEVRVVGA